MHDCSNYANGILLCYSLQSAMFTYPTVNENQPKVGSERLYKRFVLDGHIYPVLEITHARMHATLLPCTQNVATYMQMCKFQSSVI